MYTHVSIHVCIRMCIGVVAELKEQVERLRSIRECESEIDWWSRSLPSLRTRQQEAAPQEVEKPLPSCHRAERGDLRGRGEWKWVPARGGKRIPSRPLSPPQLPLSNRYGALECEAQANEDVGEAPSTGLPRMCQTAPRITTASAKKNRRVIVVGDFLLRGTEGPIHPTGKSAASLGPRLGMLLGSSLVWCGLLIITCGW